MMAQYIDKATVVVENRLMMANNGLTLVVRNMKSQKPYLRMEIM